MPFGLSGDRLDALHVDCKTEPVRCQSILIVEDEDLIRENFRMLLELEGYSPVFTARNGKEGLERLATIPRPCLILLDLLMPLMDGMEFLKAKNADETVASIPVCVVSGIADRPNLAGVVAFVKKPVDSDRLIAFVKEYCGTPSKRETM